MQLFQALKQAVSILQKHHGCWAVCGGVAASIYRDIPRFTGDIDIAIVEHGEIPARDLAEQIISALGYTPMAGWVTDQYGNLLTPQALVLGRESGGGTYVGIDFLLPVLPWVDPAVRRAQANLVDYGFARVPTLCIEDLIISKLFALQGTPSRILDLDDVLSMVRATPTVDRSYLKEGCAKYALAIPPELQKLLL
jgi:hypothetical protein